MSRSLAEIEEVPSHLLSQPLDWFAAHHQRHRGFLALMNELAESRKVDRRDVAAVVRFLRDEAGPHVAEEEDELFPLLRARAAPDDDVDELLGRLSHEHHDAHLSADALRAALEKWLQRPGATTLDAPAAEALRVFATHELRHLALENAAVLPLARLRLNAEDLQELSRRLLARGRPAHAAGRLTAVEDEQRPTA